MHALLVIGRLKMMCCTKEIEANIEGVHKVTLQTSNLAQQSSSNARNAAHESENELAAIEEITASAKSLEHASSLLLGLINKFKF